MRLRRARSHRRLECGVRPRNDPRGTLGRPPKRAAERRDAHVIAVALPAHCRDRLAVRRDRRPEDPRRHVREANRNRSRVAGYLLRVQLRNARAIGRIHDRTIIERPLGLRVRCVIALERVHHVAERVEHDDLREAAARPSRRRDPVAAARPARLGPLRVRRHTRQRAENRPVRAEHHERGRARIEARRYQFPIGARIDCGETCAVREARDVAVLVAIEIEAVLIRTHEVELREHDGSVRERRVHRDTVAPRQPLDVAIRPYALQRGRLLPVRRDVEQRPVALPPRKAHEVAAHGHVVPPGHRIALGRRARHDAVAPLPPRIAERDAEPLLRQVIQAERDRGAARMLDELSDRRVAARAREIIHEQRTAAVRDVAVRIARRRETPLVDAEHAARAPGGGDDHLLVRAFDATEAREIALEVDRESLGRPSGQVLIREERGRPAENVLRHTPPSACAIQMEDVRELVRDDEREPVIVVAEREIIQRRMRVDDHAIRWEWRRRSIREVDVVCHHQIDRASRLHEPLGQLRVRALRAHRRAARRGLERWREVDVKMLRVDRAPVRVRDHLRRCRTRGG